MLIGHGRLISSNPVPPFFTLSCYQSCMEQYITIAGTGTRYLGVTRIRPDRTNSISKHTLEDGSKTGDHLVIGQPVIDAEITLFTGQYQQLQQLATSQQLITITIPQGTYTNMALTRLTDEYGSTADTTKCKITLEQIRIVKTHVEIQRIDGMDLTAPDSLGDGVPKSLTTTNIPVSDEVLQAFADAEQPKDGLAGVMDRFTIASQAMSQTSLGDGTFLILRNIPFGKASTPEVTRFKYDGTGYQAAIQTTTTDDGEQYDTLTIKRTGEDTPLWSQRLEDKTAVDVPDPETGIPLLTLYPDAENREVHIVDSDTYKQLIS